MNKSRDGNWSAGLPYIRSIRIVLLTALINAVALFVFFWGKPLTIGDILVDAGICGVTTSFIDVFFVADRMRKLRARGALPREAPENRLMAALPRHPLWLALVFGVALGPLSALFNALVIRFYQIEFFTFAQFAIWRILYTCVLSAKIIELAVLRFMQPDCGAADGTQRSAEAVRDPLPRLSTLRQWYRTVVDDIGFNLLFGLLVGGTIIQDHLVIIPPTTRGGIGISASILGLILTVRMVYPVAKSMRAAREAGSLPVSQAVDRRVAWLPRAPARFALALLLPFTAVAVLLVWAVFTIFGFEALDFFQYLFIRMLLVTLLTKPVVKLAILRYTQPDPVNKARGTQA